jgi:MOSC domain-containing protein YiiM
MAVLRSVNLAVPAAFSVRGREIPTGIFKQPAAGRVRVGFLSLEGDVQMDKRYHGGRDKAVYVYPWEHYAHWTAALERKLPPGFFGENFTTEGLTEESVRPGDRLRAGTALFEVTAPRIPCFKLGLKVGSARFVREFLESGRLGFYLRVLEKGEVRAGDAMEITQSDPATPTLAEVIRERGKSG